jgi:hypothetical protein
VAIEREGSIASCRSAVGRTYFDCEGEDSELVQTADCNSDYVLSVARLIRQTRRARAMIEAMDARAAAARVRNRAQTGASSAFARAETGERNKQSLLRK